MPQGSLKQKDAALGGLYPRVVELEARLAQAQKQTTKADTVQLETARPETVQPCNCAEAHEAIIKSIKDAWQQEVSGLQQRLDASESRCVVLCIRGSFRNFFFVKDCP